MLWIAMMLSSSLLIIIFPLVMWDSFCLGDRLPVELPSQIFSSTHTPSQQSIQTQLATSTTSNLWLHLPRGGSTGSAPVASQLENNRQVPSLFQSEADIVYDRYAACLAATEGLRRIRDQTFQSQQQQCTNDPLYNKRNVREAMQWANAVYAENASKVVEAMGMPVEEFNSIGKIVCNDATLKQKVLEQAYLYRLQSSVAMDQIPVINKQISQSFRPISKAKFHVFCESMYEVEKLRRKLAEELKQTYRLEELPSITSQVALRPLLDSNVRSAIDSFPILASKVVHQSGLNNDEFNELLRRTKASAFFRWKVLRNVGRIERQKVM